MKNNFEVKIFGNKEDGFYIVVNGSCVSDSFITAEAAYEDYIAHLLYQIEKAKYNLKTVKGL